MLVNNDQHQYIIRTQKRMARTGVLWCVMRIQIVCTTSNSYIWCFNHGFDRLEYAEYSPNTAVFHTFRIAEQIANAQNQYSGTNENKREWNCPHAQEELLAKLKDLKGGSSDNPISRPHGYDAPAPQWKPKPERDTPKPDAKEIQWQVPAAAVPPWLGLCELPRRSSNLPKFVKIWQHFSRFRLCWQRYLQVKIRLVAFGDFFFSTISSTWNFQIWQHDRSNTCHMPTFLFWKTRE